MCNVKAAFRKRAITVFEAGIHRYKSVTTHKLTEPKT